MIDAGREGVVAIVQACNLVILAPVAMLVVAARGRWAAVVGAVAGVALGGWLFATRWLVLSDLQLRLSALIVVVALTAVALPGLDAGRPHPAVLGHVRNRVEAPAATMSISAVVGVIVTLWWRPCVGEQLGDILTRGPDAPFGQFPPTVAFMLGVSLPIVVLGLVYGVWQPRRQIAERVAMVGAGVGVVLAGSVVVGRHGEIVARLFEWSR